MIVVVSLMLSGCAMFQPKPVTAPRPAKIAVVLGAGASKGFAHIGVLKILENNKVPIHMIVGTSVGSFVGSLYAYGYDAYALQKIALSIEKSDVVDLTIPSNGFVKGERLRDYVNTKVRQAPIEKLKIPFYAVATDIKTGKSVVFHTGNTGMAVQASCSIPGVFQPASFSGTSYVDGGVLKPLAVDVARSYGADVVIAVDISSGIDTTVPTSTTETIMKSIELMYHTMSLASIREADVVIKPNVSFVGSVDFEHRNEAIMEGEKAAMAAMPKINELLKQRQ
jgi:NTE family protein